MTKKKETTATLESIREMLEDLRLPIMADELDTAADEGLSSSVSHLDLVERLVRAQYIARQNGRFDRRIKAAKFPSRKTLDDFDFAFQPKLDRQLVMQLATCEFIGAGRNVLIGGMSGTGKSHIAISLGYLACSHNMRVRYTTSADMLRTLHVGSVIDDLTQALKAYERPELLIIDEVGLDRHERDTKYDADLFYKVVSARYERQTSTLITTNINWEDWGEYLGGNDIATAAILDRLIHRGHSITIEGPSWRAREHRRLNHSLED